MGGVSKVSQNQRFPFEVNAMDNCDIVPVQGVWPRPGTEHIAGVGGTQEALDVTLVADPFMFWINRSATDRFVGFIDPDSASVLNRVQIFNVVTGVEVLVEALDSTGAEVALDDADADVVAQVAYLAAGTQTIRQRFRAITVEDSTFILNREATTALEGTAINYRDVATALIREQAHAQNTDTWADFTQPPTDIDTFPTRASLVTGGNIDFDSIWFARDDDIGLPQGFYFATSGTQPPWFQRLPTEGASSFIERENMPMRLAFDGTKFILQFVNWTERRAGDSTTNPGPSFIGLTLNDMAFHQGRFFFLAGDADGADR